jgi:hypothetical protein
LTPSSGKKSSDPTHHNQNKIFFVAKAFISQVCEHKNNSIVMYVFLKNLTYTRAGFEPWSSVPGADSISIAPRRQGKL